MKRKLAASISLALALVLSLALLLPQVVATDSSVDQTAEQCFAATKGAVFYVRGYNESGSLKSTGSGFVISKEGMAVTAAHVVQSMTKVAALLGENELEAQVLSCDAKTDIAILRLPAGSYTSLKVAEKAPAGGALVRAMGYPMKGTLIITEGIVNSVAARISGKDRMMVSCQLVNGMSGGPIVDRYGQVVGLCSGSVITMSGIHLSVLTDELNAAITQ